MQKSHGFNSQQGTVFVIYVETRSYTIQWCQINHVGSSGAMEKKGVIEMFTRLIEMFTRRYSVCVGDGNSSSFGDVKDALTAKHDDTYTIVNEDCIGYIRKRMSPALSACKNK